MSKFDTQARAQTGATTSPVTVDGPSTTYEGGEAYSRTAKSDLFMLAVVNMVGEDTFYESAGDRDQRFRDLVHAVTAEDPDWVRRFVPWLRGEANMRSASVVAACEYVKAGGPFGRKVIDAACARADEPAEVLAYWHANYGRSIPAAVKRGVADAAQRLYNQKSALKYDGQSRTWRMADVIDVTHVKPRDNEQSALFKWLLDRRHDHVSELPQELNVVRARAFLDRMPVNERRGFITDAGNQTVLASAGMTWESLSGWLQGPMDKDAWERIVPSMGAMALTRNLRNFDEAGVSDEAAAAVCATISDPENVRQSRQFPFRYFSAYQHAPSLRWGPALEKALELSTQNIPDLGSGHLVLVDTSASMTTASYSKRGTITPGMAAAVLATALAKRCEGVELYGFADGVFKHELPKGFSMLREIDRFVRRTGEVGHGTEIARSLRATFDPQRHRRVWIVSDMQTFADRYGHSGLVVSDLVPRSVPMYGFNLGGYSTTVIKAGTVNRHELGGLNDATFKLVPLLERGRRQDWPF